MRRYGLALAAAGIAAALIPAPAHAGHLLTLTGLTVAKGLEFGTTTDGYWLHSEVYRRGDRFEATVGFAVEPGWELRNATLTLRIQGPPSYDSSFDVAECQLSYAPPALPSGSCSSQQGAIRLSRFDGLSPVLEVALRRPAATDVRVGSYRLAAVVSRATLHGAEPVEDCVTEACAAARDAIHVLFNPFRGSGDGHVTGLSAAQLAFSALGPEDTYYPASAQKLTLRPSDKEVFSTAIATADALGTASARTVADRITELAASYGAGVWPVPAGSVFTTRNVPAFLRARKSGARPCGQCALAAALITAVDRSLGIPGRIVTARPTESGFDVWSEVWLNEVTNGAWSAHDADSKPARRQAPPFLGRLRALADLRPRAYATGETGAREDVTAAYGPVARAAALSANVVVHAARPVVRFGETIHFAATFANPTGRRLVVPTEATVTFERLGDTAVRDGNTVFSRRRRLTIPARGRVLTMFAVPRAAYGLNGTFAVRAAMTVGRTIHRNHAFVRVEDALDVRLLGPSSLTPGRPARIRIIVANGLPRALGDVRVTAHVPEYMRPSAISLRTALPARGRRELAVTLTPPDRVNEVIEAQAVAGAAGVAVGALPLGAASVEEPDPPALVVPVVKPAVRVTAARDAVVLLACPEDADRACSGRVELTSARARLGSEGFTTGAGRIATVKVRLSKRGAGLVRARRRVPASATVVAVDAGGTVGSTAWPITLVAA